MNDRDIMKEVLFDLSEDALYVANGGHTFTREGVIGICASYLSEKRDIQSDHYQCNDKDLISQIGEGEIELYKTKAGKNRIKADASQERETSHDYDGRFAWELLQNADDVGSSGRQPAELIGTKGLGFKSVLKITEEPEIHSGPFNFKFSPEIKLSVGTSNIHINDGTPFSAPIRSLRSRVFLISFNFEG